MRRRILKGTLVGSTDKLTAIKSRRLIIEVVYTKNYNVISQKIIDVRTSISQ
jgi:hypothetical protein